MLTEYVFSEKKKKDSFILNFFIIKSVQIQLAYVGSLK